MRAAICVRHNDLQLSRANALAAGFKRHGVESEICWMEQSPPPPENADFCICWGKRNLDLLKARGAGDVLVMELGYMGDRLEWTSLGWNGLNGRASFGSGDVGRWRRYFAPLLREWKAEDAGDYVLLAGQVPGDASVAEIDIEAWARRTTQQLEDLWECPVVFRGHPLTAKPERTLEEDLSGAKFAVTFNSNLGVDAVLSGTPAVVMDPGGMAWPVAGRDIDEVVRPNRNKWAQALAWTQWRLHEIESGAAWDVVRQGRSGPAFCESLREE